MNPLLFPGAERVPGPHSAGLELAGGNCLLTHHITVSPKNSYKGTRDYLVHEGFEPTLLLDPWYGHAGQFIPADRGAYALMHPASMPETNREGRIHIQVEWLCPDMQTDLSSAPFFAQQWRQMCVWSHALGVPYTWPFGSPLSTSRDFATWRKGGHRGHRNAPGNNHVDSLCAKHAPWPVDPAPKPQPVGDNMQRLYHITGSPPVWITDGLVRRWVQNPAELSRYEHDFGLTVINLPTGDTFLDDIPIVGKAPA